MKLLNTPTVKVIIAILLGLLVLNLETFVEKIITFVSPDLLTSFTWISPLVQSLSMLIFSILIILIISKGDFSRYGFTAGKNIRYLKIIVLSFIVGIITMIFTGIAVTLLQSIFPIQGQEHFASKYSFIETIVCVWIFASISEEVLTRGLIQGYLMSLKKYGFKLFKKHVSLPVLTGALFFAGIHIMLITTGMNRYMVCGIVFSSFILGLVAGYYREKTNSLIPAIIVHMIFNIGGAFLGLLSNLQ